MSQRRPTADYDIRREPVAAGHETALQEAGNAGHAGMLAQKRRLPVLGAATMAA